MRPLHYTLKELQLYRSVEKPDKDDPEIDFNDVDPLEPFLGIFLFRVLKKLSIKANLLVGLQRGDGFRDHPLAVVPLKRYFMCCQAVCQSDLDEECEFKRPPLPKSLQELSIRNCSPLIIGDLLALLSTSDLHVPNLKKLTLEWPRHQLDIGGNRIGVEVGLHI